MNQASDDQSSQHRGEDAGSTTYTVGDLHGEVALLRRLLDQLAPWQQDTIVLLGDYLDCGEDALATVEILTKLAESCHCIFLRGNHDEARLDTLNGSVFTRCPYIPGARPIWEQYHGLVPPRIGEFLSRTVLSHEDGYAWYSHAGAQPGVLFW